MTNLIKIASLLFVIFLLSSCNKVHQRLFQQTEDLKKYGIVFRLQDYKQRVEYFEKRGMFDRAKEEKSKIDQTNRNIMHDFQQEFKFCPVRFYLSSQTDDLLARKPVLLNEQLEPDASIPLPGKLLLASFASGKVNDNRLEYQAFRVDGTSIRIKPTYYTWWLDKPMQPEDVQKINDALYKMNTRKIRAKTTVKLQN